MTQSTRRQHVIDLREQVTLPTSTRGSTSFARLFSPMLALKAGAVFMVGVVLFTAIRGWGFIDHARALKSRVETTYAPAVKELTMSSRFLALGDTMATLQRELTAISSWLPHAQLHHFGSHDWLREGSTLLVASESGLEAMEKASMVAQSFANVAEDLRSMDLADVQQRYTSLTSFMAFQWEILKQEVIPPLEETLMELGKVDGALLPESLQASLEQSIATSTILLELFHEVDTSLPAILDMLGSEYPRTYAVILQSSGEMRATGGFIGSLALVKMNDGWMEDLSFLDVYEVDGQFYSYMAAPAGISEITNSFELRDSNYWPDFPTSARQVSWYLDQYDGPSVDGVIAISDLVVMDLLKQMEGSFWQEEGVFVTSETFAPLMSFLVESKVDREQPKSYLFSFAQSFIKDYASFLIANPAKIVELGHLVEEQRVLAYSSEQHMQQVIEKFGMDGRLLAGTTAMEGDVEDFFSLVYTNIGGNKSDRYMFEDLIHHTTITSDRRAQVTVSLRREHLWNELLAANLAALVQENFDAEISGYVERILGDGVNKHYMRMYVPLGARVLGSSGIGEITTHEDLGKTVISFISEVPPGESRDLSVTYELPVPVLPREDGTLAYSSTLQKQPGGMNIPVIKTFAMEGDVGARMQALPKKELTTTSLFEPSKEMLSSSLSYAYVFAPLTGN